MRLVVVNSYGVLRKTLKSPAGRAFKNINGLAKKQVLSSDERGTSSVVEMLTQATVTDQELMRQQNLSL